MYEPIENLIYEIFVREERCQAELRLSPDEVEYLQRHYAAACRPLSEQDDTGGKRWYFVEMQC